MSHLNLRKLGSRPETLDLNTFLSSLDDDSVMSQVSRIAVEYGERLSSTDLSSNTGDLQEKYRYLLDLELFFSGFFSDVATEIGINRALLSERPNLEELVNFIARVQRENVDYYINLFIFFIGENGMDTSIYDHEAVWEAFGSHLFDHIEDDASRDAKIAEIETKFREWIRKNLDYYFDGYSQVAQTINGALANCVPRLIQFYEMIGEDRDSAIAFAEEVIDAEANRVAQIKGISATTRSRLDEVRDPAFVMDQLGRF